MDDDITTMLEFKNGDRSAFDKIINKYQKPIINFIHRFTGDKNSAEDLSQETFIRIYNAAKNYMPSAKFTTWIYRIASNIAIDYIRKKKTQGKIQSMDEYTEEKEDGTRIQISDDKRKPADEMMEQEETETIIRRALQSLPENQRLAIILRVYEDRPYYEIASVLGVSIASVESLLFRARQALKGFIKI